MANSSTRAGPAAAGTAMANLSHATTILVSDVDAIANEPAKKARSSWTILMVPTDPPCACASKTACTTSGT
jgi:hypothetical protein